MILQSQNQSRFWAIHQVVIRVQQQIQLTPLQITVQPQRRTAAQAPVVLIVVVQALLVGQLEVVILSITMVAVLAIRPQKRQVQATILGVVKLTPAVIVAQETVNLPPTNLNILLSPLSFGLFCYL